MVRCLTPDIQSTYMVTKLPLLLINGLFPNIGKIAVNREITPGGDF